MTESFPEVKYRYLALGDSYTIGVQVEPEESWPVQLTTQLQKQGVPLVPPVIIAKNGWTTSELLHGIAKTMPKGPFNLVSLLIGVNNQYRGETLASYRNEFRNLLDQAIALAGGLPGRVIVLSIPDWGVTPFATKRDRARIEGEINAFNAVNLAETAERDAHYLDITGLTRLYGTDLEMLAEDELHPSGKMYALWVAHAIPLVREILANQSDISEGGFSGEASQSLGG